MKNKTAYPANWKQIANAVKQLAQWQCESCNHPHDPKSGHTLTVHHLDGNPANCNYTNLVALCQRCHLRIQAKYVYGQTFMSAPWWARIRSLDTFDMQQMTVINQTVRIPKPL